jgi:hypothetical protein
MDDFFVTPSQKALINQIPAALSVDLLNSLPVYHPILFHSYLLESLCSPKEYRKIVLEDFSSVADVATNSAEVFRIG